MYHAWCQNLSKTADLPQTNGEIYLCNLTLVSRLRDFAVKNQEDYDNFVYLIAYAYNTQVYKSTNLTTSILILSLHPLGPATVLQPNTLPTNNWINTTNAD